MTYEVYRYIFLAALILSGVMLATSVVLFFVLKVPQLVSDLSGRTARRAIEDIRKQNEQTGDKSYKSSAVNLQRGKVTDKISKSGRLIQNNDSPFGTGIITEQLSQPGAMPPTEETTVLTVTEGTTVLMQEADETTVLTQQAPVVPAAPEAPQAFVIEYEVTYIHTNEVIT